MKDWHWLLLASPFVLAAACSAQVSELDDEGAGGGTSVTSTAASGTGGIDLTSVGGSGGGTPCMSTDTNDWDQDGFTVLEGDCNDCDPNVSPNSLEVPTKEGGVPIDEDCDGEIDEEEPLIACDEGIAIDESDPMVVVKAVELCKVSSGPKDWGVVSAIWAFPDGTPAGGGPTAANFHLGHGVLSSFGNVITTRFGDSMLVLSSGTARQPTDPGYQDVGGFAKGYTTNHPTGFPKESPACPGTTTGTPHDTAGIEVKIRAPQNAHGITFDFNFYTYEWPGFVCSSYNDFFVALLEPFPMGQSDGNISYDSMGNPVSVNNAFLDVCGCLGNPPSPCFAGGKTFTCPLGNTELLGTGFGFDTGWEDHAATSWLQTTAPVIPGSEFTLRWAVYDSGDGVLDSTALIDNFRWIAEPGVPVGTTPIPK
jgi:hypothetical protein